MVNHSHVAEKLKTFQQAPIRVNPEAMQVLRDFETNLGWPKAKIVSSCILAVEDLINHRKESRFVELLRVASATIEEDPISKGNTDLSPEAIQAIRDVVQSVIQGQTPAMNEEPTPYKAKKKKAGGKG